MKTLASKHKISVAKAYQHYKFGKHKSEWFKSKDVNRITKTNKIVDVIYNIAPNFAHSEITERLKAEEYEYC
ncbi:MAG: hypothetical protein P8O70_03760 [SAR324 cluster bacterium]|nr:hypothetical protein [SAR324 cluster bacterium]